jgi:SNF2 family DNA or RNA helicase
MFLAWNGARAGSKAWQAAYQQALAHKGLLFFAMNIDAIITKAGKAALNALFAKRRYVMTAIDESQIIKTPGATRTPAIRAIARKSVVRRLLTGTPVTESPLDLYNQMHFLDPAILGFKTNAEFKAHYAEWEERSTQGGDTYKVIKHFKNMEEMKARLAGYSSRVLRSECADLPPKLYQKVWFSLTPAQRRVYDDLRDQYVAEINGNERVVLHALTRLMRLQQVTSNCFPAPLEAGLHDACSGQGCDECDGGYWFAPVRYEPIDHKNPRLEALRDLLADENPPKCVIWARFNHDIEEITQVLDRLGRTWTRYDGTVKDQERAAGLRQFQNGTVQDLISKPRAGGRGLNMAVARTEIFYSNEFSLEGRLQAEDRCETVEPGAGPVSIIDIVCDDTVDMKIVDTLREKRRLSDLVTGDDPREWL